MCGDVSLSKPSLTCTLLFGHLLTNTSYNKELDGIRASGRSLGVSRSASFGFPFSGFVMPVFADCTSGST
jgi:hypothetical protein